MAIYQLTAQPVPVNAGSPLVQTKDFSSTKYCYVGLDVAKVIALANRLDKSLANASLFRSGFSVLPHPCATSAHKFQSPVSIQYSALPRVFQLAMF
jgi:hypothetical protein